MDWDLNMTRTFAHVGNNRQTQVTGPSRGPRPKEVPVLALEGLQDRDEEDYAVIAGMPSSPLSSMSWGSSPSAQRPETWDVGVRDTPQRNTPLVENLESLRSGCRGLLPNNPSSSQKPNPEPSASCHASEHTRIQTNDIHTRTRKLEAEGLTVERRKEAVMEQMMVDQLCRAVISDPEQNSANPVNISARHKRTLHHTMVKTQKSLTENLLSHKLRFHARIISRCGREACRELIGFFFTCDHSLTVYEYRSFGKNRYNVLPFIARGVYRTQGRPYCLADFAQGADLWFRTDVLHIPEKLRQRPYMNLRITDVDEEAKCSLLASGETTAGLSEEDNYDQKTLRAIQGAVRARLKGHAARTLMALGRRLACFDLQEKGLLDKEKLRECLIEELNITYQEFETVWRIVGQQGEVLVDSATVMRAVTGEMSEARKAVFIKVYVKLDPHKTGSVSLTDIEKFYWARQNPEHGAKIDFLTCVLNTERVEGKVAYAEFEDYYEGLSIEILSDQEYTSILSSAWSV
ncbi:calcyphosin-2 isoform X2 [Brachyhypopomus gauderio]|uniref:calcyphosin-2 isoform X2 n=1 Tax=Brachyhypopomus gauderio TaxID=698409 RepID=UPI00404345B4